MIMQTKRYNNGDKFIEKTYNTHQKIKNHGLYIYCFGTSLKQGFFLQTIHRDWIETLLKQMLTEN